jgi:proline iminopeptidase
MAYCNMDGYCRFGRRIRLSTWTIVAFIGLLISGCATIQGPGGAISESYLDYSDRADFLSGGVRLITIATPKGTFNVWTRRVGNNPTIKVLLLHGGPGGSSDDTAVFDSFFPGAGIEYYHYDQLGSYRSDAPNEPGLWEIDRFVDEVEQVRVALGLDSSNFYLWGQSWGGILAIEYALAHQENLKAIVVSNMVSSVPQYNRYADEVFKTKMDPEVLSELEAFEAAEDYHNPRYEELLLEHHYVHHLLRMPSGEWPDAVNIGGEHINADVYIPMQGPSELGASGKLENWDRSNDLHKIRVPALMIGATYDTMDPAHMAWMASEVQNGRYHHCNGGHLAQFDDAEVYFEGLIRFIKDVDAGRL